MNQQIQPVPAVAEEQQQAPGQEISREEFIRQRLQGLEDDRAAAPAFAPPPEGPAPPAAETQPQEQEPAQEQPKLPRFQQRFNQVWHERQQARVKVTDLENQLAQVRGGITQAPQAQMPQPQPVQPQPQQQQAPGLPKFPVAKPELVQFEDYDVYRDAVDDWRNSQRQWEGLQRQKLDIIQQEAQREMQWTRSRIEEAEIAHPGFRQTAVEVGNALSHYGADPRLADVILESEHFTPVTLYLRQHPEIIHSLSQMPLPQAQREIFRIETQMAADSAVQRKLAEQQQATAVERPGSGLPPQQGPNLGRMMDESKRTGDWAAYLDARLGPR